MQKILVLGAGLSATSLIKYLLDKSTSHNWMIYIADLNLDLVKEKIGSHPNGQALLLDASDNAKLEDLIRDKSLVISMLPAFMHFPVGQFCVKHKVHMVTASYASDEIKTLDEAAKKAGITLINEVGVDPGIDHMSAMKVIDKIKEKGGEITLFKSSTGGLVAPKYDNNPWNYKFTWNPRNVVLAGQGVSKFIRNGKYKYIPYHKLFSRLETTNVLDVGEFEIYANRDSLKYRNTYGLDNVPTMFRGTMRRPGFCRSWNVFVQLGMTDDSYVIEDSENMTYRDFLNSFLQYEENIKLETKLMSYLNINVDSSIMYKLRWLGILDEKPIGLKRATPAQILQHLLVSKWSMDEDDKDMIVMQHQFEYTINNIKRKTISSLVVKGKDKHESAMAMTVGLPVAIASKLLLTGQIKEKGLLLPIDKDVYNPILNELEDYNIKFVEEELM